jgi:hypothetical protein
MMTASIAASLATVVIAYRHADEDVRELRSHAGSAATATVGPGETAAPEAAEPAR